MVPCIENTNRTANTSSTYGFAALSGISSAVSPTSRWKLVVRAKPPSSIVRRLILFITRMPTEIPSTLARPNRVFPRIAASAEKPASSSS